MIAVLIIGGLLLTAYSCAMEGSIANERGWRFPDVDCDVFCEGRDNGMCCKDGVCICCSPDMYYAGDYHCEFKPEFYARFAAIITVAVLFGSLLIGGFFWKFCYRKIFCKSDTSKNTSG